LELSGGKPRLVKEGENGQKNFVGNIRGGNGMGAGYSGLFDSPAYPSGIEPDGY
jgi:hypothetical protein